MCSSFFISLADNTFLLEVINHLNTYGLIAIGLGLILGFLARPAALAGILLVSLYYLSHPPLIDVKQFSPGSENVLWVNKNLIFIGVLFILYAFPTSCKIGIDRVLFNKKETSK
jgi:thiosulfate dehydrogenase [quinone] large subunit